VDTLAVTRRFDLTDAQWAVLEPLLPAPARSGRRARRRRRPGAAVIDQAPQALVAVAHPHPLDRDRARRLTRPGQLSGLGRVPFGQRAQARVESPRGRASGPAPGASPVATSTTCRSHSRAR